MDGDEGARARERILSAPAECPKCLRLRATRIDAIGWCPVCMRWQYLKTASFIIVPRAVYRHLGCCECRLTTWCRDLLLQAAAERCAYRAHAHEPGECPGDVPRLGAVDRSTWRTHRRRAAK